MIQPLDDVATALDMKEEDFAPEGLGGGSLPGKGAATAQRFGIPFDMHPAGLYFNKTVLEKIGEDPETAPTNG